MKHTFVAFLLILSFVVTPFHSTHAATPTTPNTELIQKLLAQIELLQAELQKLIAARGGNTTTTTTTTDTTTPCTFTRLLIKGTQGADVMCLQNFLKSKGYFQGTATGYFGPVTEVAVSAWQHGEGIVAEPWEYGHFGEQSRVVYARSLTKSTPVVAPIVSTPTETTTPPPTSNDTVAPTVPGTPSALAIASTSITFTWASSTDNVGVYRYRVFKNGRELGTTKTAQFIARDLSPDTLYRFSIVAIDRVQNTSARSPEISVRTLTAGAVTLATSTEQTSAVKTPTSTPVISSVASVVPYNPSQALPITTGLPSGASTFYVDAVSGNDSNNGTTPSTAWKTLAKVSSASLPPGSSVLFKKGQTFYGALIVKNGGTVNNPITFGAYGSGAKPKISGFLPVVNWKNNGNSIWESTDPVSSLATVTVVMIENESVPMGRYPNTGFLSYETFIGRTAITSRALNSGVNWTGAEIVAKRQRWILERNRILSQSGSTLTFAQSYYEGKEGWGFFIQNDSRTLDKKNEWYYNPGTKKLLVYGRTTPTDVKVSSVDNLVTLLNTPYVVIDGLAFEGGNKAAIYIANAQNVTIKNSTISYSYDGILGAGSASSANLTIEKSSIDHMQNNGITLLDKHTDALIRDNVIEDTGLLPGMGGWPTGTYVGISAKGSGTRIDHNQILRSGYDAITFGGTNSVVSNNYIDTFCIIKDDGAGIYINTNNEPTRTGIKIIGNIIVNAVGNNDGVARGGASEAEGIYLDESVENVEVTNNTVGHTTHTGIYLHNNKGNNIVRDNTVYDANIGFWIKNDGRNGNLSQLRNLSATNNIFFAKTETQMPMHVATAFDDIRNMGMIDRNIYVRPTESNQLVVGQLLGDKTTTNYYTLPEWRTYSGFDANSTPRAIKLSGYKLNGLTSSNLYPNGEFATDKNNFQVWSPTANTTLVWDNTSKITGSGSVQIVPQSPNADFALITGSLGTAIPISPSKNYILRFTTVGTTETGSLRVHLRRMGAPYTSLTPLQVATFGTAKKTHEFLFTTPTADDAATFVIQFKEDSGLTYIDDVALYEADVTLGGPLQSRFEYNASDAPKTITLDGSYVDVRDVAYSGSITVQPWSSVVLYKKPEPLTKIPTTTRFTTASTKTTLEALLKQLQALEAELKKLKH